MIVLAWLALALPGLVFVLTRMRSSLEAGVLPTLGLSWLCSFTAYFILSVPCFALGASLDLYLGLIGMLYVWAAVEMVRKKPWQQARKAGVELLGFETVLFVLVGIGYARLGANPGGDAIVHVTRVRQILDHGLTNLDPWVGDGHFFSLYHTNLMHTLHAVVARVTGTHFIEGWHASLGASAMIVVCGGAQLAWQLHRSRWAAWAGGFCTLVAVGTTAATLLSLPNKLAPFFFVPTALAFALAFVRKPERTNILLLAAAVLATSATHALYGVFLVILLAPLLGLNWLRTWRKREGSPKLAAWALIALILAAAPMPLVSQITKGAPKDAKASATLAEKRQRNTEISEEERRRRRKLRRMKKPKTTQDDPTRYVQVGERYIVNPRRGFGGMGGIKIRFAGIRYVLLAAGLALALAIRRSRPAAIALSIILLTGSSVLFIPHVATAFAGVTGGRWMLLRFVTATFPIPLAVSMAGLAGLLETRLKRPWFRIAGTALALAAVFFAWGKSHVKQWESIIENARVREAHIPESEIKKMRDMRAAMDEYVPPSARVLIDMDAGMQLVRLADVRILAPTRAALGVEGLHNLRVLNRNLISADVPWERRRSKLKEYNVRFFLPLKFPKWAVGHVKRDIRDPRLGNLVLLELDLEDQ